MISMQQVIERAADLPAMSPTVGRLAAAVGDTESTTDDIVEIIQYDQVITLDIMRMVNSAASAASRTITSLREAVVRLGGSRILARVVGRRVRRDLSNALPVYGYSERDLWRHSAAAALAAEHLSARIKPGGELSFTAALLHDVGKLLLGRAAPRADMEAVWRLVTGQGCSCEQAERQVFGFSHADVGAALTGLWHMPDDITAAVRDHHAVLAPAHATTDIVKVANIVARAIGEGVGNEGMSVAVDGSVGERVGLTREGLERLCADTAERLAGLLAAYEMA